MPGRHRHLQRTGLVVTAAAISVAVVAGGAWAGYRELSKHDCSSTVQLKVAASAEIAPAVQAAAATLAGSCVAVTVNAADPTGVAAAIGGKHGVNLPGVGTAKQDTAGTDIWLPDSSTWLIRLASEAPGFQPSMLGSVASSPLVLAAPEPAAKALGWPATTPPMSALVKRIAVDKSLRPGIVDPPRDATGLAGLLTLGAAAGTGPSAGALKVGMMRALAANSSTLRPELMLQFPRSEEEIGNSVSLAPLSEAGVIAYNRDNPGIPLAALYPKPAVAALDYPYAIMPGIDPEKATAAATLHVALGSSVFLDQLARAGLRGPSGTTGAGFPALSGAPATAPPPPAPKDPKLVATAIAQLLGSWTAITQPGRMLAVFDVSGSMKAKVPTAGGLTRAQVTQGVAKQGLALLDNRWSVGNWTFSTDMAGKRPWIENLPILPCATHRAEQEAAIDKIVPKDGGDTGLYDTAVAAYARVQKGWQPGVSNSVVIYTDGKNDNPAGLTIGETIDQLTKLRDPEKPVRLIVIGMGTAIDRNELEQITKAAGSGGVYIATDPAKIGEIFLEAIASRRGA